MTVIGEARYTNKTLVLSTPLNLEEGMRVIVLEIEGAYVLIPVSQDEAHRAPDYLAGRGRYSRSP
jgi:ERCC4-related helicase